MLDRLLDNDEFALLMKTHVYECLDFLLQSKTHFSVLVNLPLVKFEPELPERVKIGFNAPALLFTLAGYTFESAELTREELNFEAGFGNENFASVVSFPLGAVVQILVENSPVLVNFAIYKKPVRPHADKNKTQKSMFVFMSNPNNKEFLKGKK